MKLTSRHTFLERQTGYRAASEVAHPRTPAVSMQLRQTVAHLIAAVRRSGALFITLKIPKQTAACASSTTQQSADCPPIILAPATPQVPTSRVETEKEGSEAPPARSALRAAREAGTQL